MTVAVTVFGFWHEVVAVFLPEPAAAAAELEHGNGRITHIAGTKWDGVSISLQAGEPYLLECKNNARDQMRVKVEVFERGNAQPIAVWNSTELADGEEVGFVPSRSDIDIWASYSDRSDRGWHRCTNRAGNMNRISLFHASMAWGNPHVNVEVIAYNADTEHYRDDI